MPRCIFTLDSFQINSTRSFNNDTDVVTFAVKAGNQLFPSVTKSMGDVNNGVHKVGLAVGPVEVDSGIDVTVSYIIANSGNSSDLLKVLNFLSDKAAVLCTLIFQGDSAWAQINSDTQWINKFLLGNCDGLVAGDSVLLTGDTIISGLSSAGAFTQSRPYTGTPTPRFQCNNANSQYIVNWTAREVGAEANQDVLADLRGIVGIAGYFGQRDKFQHAIVATNDGTLHELWWAGGGAPVGHGVLGTFPGMIGVAGYFGQRDNYQHAIVATKDGTLHELWWEGGGHPVGHDVLGTFPGIVGVAGYFNSRDTFQHVLVATRDGNINELWWAGGGAGDRGEDVRAHFNGIQAIAGYFAPRDNLDHLIVATKDGNINEVWFGVAGQSGQDVLAHFDGIVDIAAYYSPSDNYQHVLVATTDGKVNELWFPGGGGTRGQDVRANFDSIVGLAGYYAAGDNYQHVLVATNDGKVHEAYWTP